jgi:biopolymer transport protein ExbD
MAFNFNAGRTGGRRGRLGAMSEINIVPLVDVVLVLLVIFMLTAHVLEFGLEIEVPKVKQVRETTEELPVVTLSRNGELYLNEKPVNIHRLGEEFRQRFPGARAVYVRADRNTIWDPIAQVIGVLGEQKIDVRVVTQPGDGASGN